MGGVTDPASTETAGPFTMMSPRYMRTELNYKTDTLYYTAARRASISSFPQHLAIAPPPGEDLHQLRNVAFNHVCKPCDARGGRQLDAALQGADRRGARTPAPGGLRSTQA